MPIYEYKCKHCGHVFDEFQKVGDTGENLKCPSCGAAKPEKMFSAFASCGGDTASISSSGGASCGSGGFG